MATPFKSIGPRTGSWFTARSSGRCGSKISAAGRGWKVWKNGPFYLSTRPLAMSFTLTWRTTTSRSPLALSGSPEQLLGNPAAPYLNSLMTPGNPNAAQTSYASNYYNVATRASTRLSRTTSGRRRVSAGPSTTSTRTPTPPEPQ